MHPELRATSPSNNGGQTTIHWRSGEEVEMSTKPVDGPENIEIYGTLSIGDLYPDGVASSLILNLRAVWIGEWDTCRLAAVGRLREGTAITPKGQSSKLPATGPLRTQPALEILWPVLVQEGYEPGAIFGNYSILIRELQTASMTISGICTVLLGNRIPVQLRNFNRFIGQEIDDPNLAATGLKISLVKSKDETQFDEIVVSVNEGYLLSTVDLTNLERTSRSFSSKGEDNRTQRLGCNSQNENLVMETSIFSNLEEVIVPFSFENVELPNASDN